MYFMNPENFAKDYSVLKSCMNLPKLHWLCYNSQY